jgi:hypothetical protein
MQLSKIYRIAWKDDLSVIIIGKFDANSVTGTKNGYDADTKAEINSKIKELGLKLTDDQKNDWQQV